MPFVCVGVFVRVCVSTQGREDACALSVKNTLRVSVGVFLKLCTFFTGTRAHKH